LAVEEFFPNRNSMKRIYLSPPHVSAVERDLLLEAFDSNWIAPLGPMVDAFEREFAEYVGIPHCLALASGTAAMHLALRELGVGPGDRVFASSLTFIGSVSPATFLGAELVFIDSERASWNMETDLLAEALKEAQRQGRLPKVVVPTDLYGQCVNLDRIRALCDPLGVPVVADAAEAMGARYRKEEGRRETEEGGRQRTEDSGTVERWRHAGVGARAAVFSFNGNKIMTTSGGGMLASEDSRLIEHARKLSQQARDPAPHYEHSEIGYNYRMSNVLAAIGRGQLKVLDERVLTKRRLFESYQRLLGDLPGIEFMPEADWSRANRWLTVVLIDPEKSGTSNEKVRLALEAENIESRPLWKPMHLQPVFHGCRTVGGSVSEDLFQRGLCLPSGTAMTDSDLARVIEVIRRCWGKA
jgi:dTDP-4-amino-4,6-dideoxygalactose transaminase